MLCSKFAGLIKVLKTYCIASKWFDLNQKFENECLWMNEWIEIIYAGIPCLEITNRLIEMQLI